MISVVLRIQADWLHDLRGLGCLPSSSLVGMARALVYGLMDLSSILALFIVFFPPHILREFSKLGAVFGYNNAALVCTTVNAAASCSFVTTL